MHRTNIINKVIFDIHTDAGLEALSPEEPLEDFVRTRLIPVLDEVLRAHSTSGALISIASLEIDLGTLEHENICEKMAERLRERLDAAIRDKIRSLQGVPSRQEGVFTEPEAACRLIEQFLSTGTVPWATDPGADVPLSHLLRSALASHGRQLVAFLKRSAPHVRKRLIRQFPAHDLIALLQLLAPDHYRLVIEAVDRVQQSTAVISAGSEITAHLAWEKVFDYLLDREREGFRPDEFVACLISGIAVAAGTNTARLVRELTAAAPELDVASESRSGLHTLLTALTGDDARDGNETRAEDFERLKPVLVNMLEFGDTSGFDTAWGNLLLYYPDLTSAVIREHGKKSVVRKRIATFFSDAQIREVIRLIEPENSEFIEAFAHQSALIADDERVRPPDRSVHKKQIWEFVLTYLLVDRGSRFNEKSFSGSVIRQLAAHYNWTYYHFLTSLREGIEMTQSPGLMKERILGIVTELEGELKTEIQLRKDPAPESRRQIRGTDLYAFLELHLMGEAKYETISGDPLSVLAGLTVRELQRDHPEILLRLFKFLQSRPDAVRRAAGRLSADRLEQLATAFLVLFSSPSQRQRELHAAIARWADRAPDRREYFAAVLDAVVRGELIDVEAIVAGLQKHAVPEPSTGAVADPPLTALYLTWFLTVAPLDPREKTLYLSLLEDFVTDSPQVVGQYLIHMIKEPSLCAAFVQLTPWRLIRKAMAAMAGFTDAMQYVAILEGVFRPGTPAARCRPADFVKVVIGVLAEQQLGDGEAFLKTAFERLVAHIGDAAARERAVDALEKIVSTKGASLRSIAAHYRDTTNLVPTGGGNAPSDTRTPEEAAVMAYLKGDDPAEPSSLPALKKALETMILHTPEKLYWFIAAHIDRSSVTEKLIALLSEPFQARLLHLLLPRHFGQAQRYVDLLRNAAYGPGRFDSPDEVNQRIWQGMFSYLRETGLRVFDQRALVRRMVEFLAEKRKKTDRAAFYADLGRQLAADIQPSTRADHQTLIRIVSEAAQKTRLSEFVPPSPETPPAGTVSVLNDDEEETPWDEEIYVANAGMVIAAPYLPRLFELLGLTEQSRFTSREAAERGVHLLQYMVDERTSTPEYRLVLNKLLCGVKPGIPIVREIVITDKETEAITNMITAMIQNWKILGNTSVAGFRESFLRREARLMRKNDAWHLQVEEQAFDMLLDQIPWSFSTIKYSWMDRVIFVKWRE